MYILPKPAVIEEKDGAFLLNYTAYLVLDDECSRRNWRQTQMLAEKIEEYTGFSLHLTKGQSRKGDIQIGMLHEENNPEGYYKLLIEKDRVQILGTEATVLYGIQTLLQIIEQSGALLPCLEIQDYPQLANRGFYHDATRGRVSKLSYLKKLADQMMRYKLNQLQLYMEHTYLFRDFSEVWRDDTPLTPEEIMELDDYCYDRGIELVPSISTCSHLYKLLRTKQWQDLCELDNPDQERYTGWGKQTHHTIDISNKKSLDLIKNMISEYRPLFRTEKFNICADETFDLGKGKSKEYCDQMGLGKAYVGYVKKLCEHVLSLGCTPMMWGDVILNYPEMLKEFPTETIFLNWAYHSNVTDENTRIFGDKNVKFYNCPGVSGWCRLCNDYEGAYENIRRMAEYAKENHAIGLLNTDWGDYYHTVHPEFSLIGMIYGAQFSWCENKTREELNKEISSLEFGISDRNLPELLTEINKNALFQWNELCIYQENAYDPSNLALAKDARERILKKSVEPKQFNHAQERLLEIKRQLSRIMAEVKPEHRQLLAAYEIAVDGCRYLNQLGNSIQIREDLKNEETDSEITKKDRENLKVKDQELATELEQWFYYYKRLWRSVSEESELSRIQAIMDEYCDYLRS
ncbi:family 20 glycosylhydrolase [Blautia liquoris]|uniref:Family 20 glycosylhydrolase n=1 Tax=Blautia liquoris TaxID=2779518 RepID=A0A7M2RJR7_9FIRM|nr:glycoside hydrolase family 20 zincin-like fold domain-containing protein [Blautia liquoris]QOV20378.1 family 20 glycosylhydrolase [Blautia liquoris]